MQGTSLLSSFALISRWTLSPDSSCFDLSSLNELCLGHYHTLLLFLFLFFLPFFFVVVLCSFYLLEFASSYQLSDKVQRLGCEGREKGPRKPLNLCLVSVLTRKFLGVPLASVQPIGKLHKALK